MIIPESPNVLVIYADDFADHRYVVHTFTRYLIKQKVNVSLDVSDENYHGDHSHWYDIRMEQAHKIVVIHSEGAYKRYMWDLKGIHYKDNEIRCPPDMFLYSFRHAKQWHQEKIIHVWFSHTEEQYQIKDPSGTFYYLPKWMESMFLSMHDKTKKNYNATNTFLLVKANGELNKAVQKAKAYVQRNPNWFQKRYTIIDNPAETSDKKEHGDAGVYTTIPIHEIEHSPAVSVPFDTRRSPFVAPDFPEVSSGSQLNHMLSAGYTPDFPEVSSGSQLNHMLSPGYTTQGTPMTYQNAGFQFTPDVPTSSNKDINIETQALHNFYSVRTEDSSEYQSTNSTFQLDDIILKDKGCKIKPIISRNFFLPLKGEDSQGNNTSVASSSSPSGTGWTYQSGSFGSPPHSLLDDNDSVSITSAQIQYMIESFNSADGNI